MFRYDFLCFVFFDFPHSTRHAYRRVCVCEIDGNRDRDKERQRETERSRCEQNKYEINRLEKTGRNTEKYFDGESPRWFPVLCPNEHTRAKRAKRRDARAQTAWTATTSLCRASRGGDVDDGGDRTPAACHERPRVVFITTWSLRYACTLGHSTRPWSPVVESRPFRWCMSEQDCSSHAFSSVEKRTVAVAAELFRRTTVHPSNDPETNFTITTTSKRVVGSQWSYCWLRFPNG